MIFQLFRNDATRDGAVTTTQPLFLSRAWAAFRKKISLETGNRERQPKSLNSSSRSLLVPNLSSHALEGYYYSQGKAPDFKEQWKKQLTHNLMVRDELETLGQSLEKQSIETVVLKGFALMGDIYQDWGARFASDVDLLVSENNLWRLKEQLGLFGYQEVSQKKWQGNCFKSLFKKNIHGISLTIEVHTQLFWHTKVSWSEHLEPSSLFGFSRLKKEMQLLHLCGHYGFQHTMIKLYWLVDIIRYMRKHGPSLHWPLFWNLAVSHRLFRCSYGVLSLLDNGIQDLLFENQGNHKPHRMLWLDSVPPKALWSRPWVARLATPGFLQTPRKYPFRYLLLKCLLKDSFSLNYTYFRQWWGHKRAA